MAGPASASRHYVAFGHGQYDSFGLRDVLLGEEVLLELQVTDPVDELAGVVLCLKSEILSSGADPQYKCITNNNSQISSNFLLLLPCFPSSNCSNMIITRLVLEIP